MRVLLLGPTRETIASFLVSCGDEPSFIEAPISLEIINSLRPEFLVSYGYRHILKEEILNLFPKRAINLHISYLPWNRGADPNFWSFAEDTPKGVTIHFIDAGIDTGEIIAQRTIEVFPNDTLRTSYDRLSLTIESLFRETWPLIRIGQVNSKPQPLGGSFHRRRDLEKFRKYLTLGWDTPIKDIIGIAKNKI